MSGDPAAAIELDAVTVRFGRVHALRDVGFVVPAGSITGLIGRNGAGKSTTIRLLAGLLDPSEPTSRVRVFGLGVPEARERILARSGFLLSDPALFPYLTPSETLDFLGRAYRLPPAEVRTRTAELLAFFELEEAAARLADEFSTGMRKRLGLAAALIHGPELLVLDEPFESLDPLMVRQLKRLIVDFSAGGGTVLLSSHLIDAVDEICDRVVILEEGRVVTEGTREEAKASIADRLPEATLEDLYASLVPEVAPPGMRWLTRLERG
jgi:ABC-2 type transport system ATP-binding protein